MVIPLRSTMDPDHPDLEPRLLQGRIRELEAELAKQTVRNGVVTSGVVALATTVLGVLISLN